MNYTQLIKSSWDITTHHPKLKWFCFVPSLAAIMIFVLEVTWQLLLYSEEFAVINTGLHWSIVIDAWNYVIDQQLWLWIALALMLILLFFFVVPIWVECTLIIALRRHLQRPEDPINLPHAFVSAHDFFARLFEATAISSIISPWAIILFVATFYRFFHDSLFPLVSPMLLTYFLLSFVLSIFLSYVYHYIIFEKNTLTSGIKNSIRLVFINFTKTLAVYLILLLIGLRTIINVIIAIGIPVLLISAVLYFSNALVLFLIGLISLALLCISAYIMALLQVFSVTLWIKTFLHLKSLTPDEKIEN